MAYAFCQRLAADGTGYADVIINPTHWSAWRGRTRAMIDALDAGFAAAEQDGLRAAVQRLAGQGPGDMGALFKALAVASRPLPIPPFSAVPSSADASSPR